MIRTVDLMPGIIALLAQSEDLNPNAVFTLLSNCLHPSRSSAQNIRAL